MAKSPLDDMKKLRRAIYGPLDDPVARAAAGVRDSDAVREVAGRLPASTARSFAARSVADDMLSKPTGATETAFAEIARGGEVARGDRHRHEALGLGNTIHEHLDDVAGTRALRQAARALTSPIGASSASLAALASAGTAKDALKLSGKTIGEMVPGFATEPDTISKLAGSLQPDSDFGLGRAAFDEEQAARRQTSELAGYGGLRSRYETPLRSVLDRIGTATNLDRPVAASRAKREEALPSSPVKPSPSTTAISSVADIGRRVRDARKSMGMTQQRFADLAGVGRRFLIELEQGKPSLEIGRVLAVCRAAGIMLSITK